MGQFLVIISLLLLSCGPSKTEIECKSDKNFKLGDFEVSLPDCYELFYPTVSKVAIFI